MSDEFRRYASLYREALSSNSPAYQFLVEATRRPIFFLSVPLKKPRTE